MAYTYSNSDATSRAIKATGSILKRMSDSELENIARKLQEYFAIQIASSNWTLYHSFFGGYYGAKIGSIYMSDFDRSTGYNDIRGYKIVDTKFNATISSKSNNAFDNFADDDDSFAEPGAISEVEYDQYYMVQKHNANFGTGAQAGLQSGGDYYNEIRNLNSSSSFSNSSNLLNNYSPSQWIRDFMYASTDSSGNPHTQGDIGKIAEAIFKMVTARIRSNDDYNFGSYHLGTSSPGDGWREVSATGLSVNDSNSTFYYAFRDSVSGVNGLGYRFNLDYPTFRYNYSIYIKVPHPGGTYDHDSTGTAGSGVRPVHIEKWKVTVHSGSGVNVDTEGRELAFWVADNSSAGYFSDNKYFYFKPANTNGTEIYLSSDYTSSTPSSTSFSSTATTLPGFQSDMTAFNSPANLSTHLIRPESGGYFPYSGFLAMYSDRSYTTYNTSTVYKCERMTTLMRHDLPTIENFNNLYNIGGGYIGIGDYSGATRTAARNNLRTNALIQTLYKLYTLGMYYPQYKLKSLGFGFTGSSTASGEFSHGFAMNTRKSGIGGPAGNYQTVVTTPGIFDGVPSGESGTYYRIRYAGATTYDVNTTHLMSESDI